MHGTMSAVQAEAVPGTPKGKGRLKREATEAALIAAFGRIVERNGLRNVGVNEVLKAAGLGKALLYRYFGGLPGLVRAWGEKNRVWPELSDMAQLADALEREPVAGQLKRMVVRNANAHRERPLRVELLADEIMAPSPISEALSGIRQQLGQEHAAIFARNPELREHRLLLVVMMAAASYLAMRAVKSPRFMGQDLSDEHTWQRLMREIERIIDRAAVDEKQRQSVSAAAAGGPRC
jgi:AcrR family transcriptional regulator